MPGFFGGDDDGDRPRGRAEGNFLTRDAGPLPVWGWLVVGVAAVFLYRAMVAPKPKAGDEADEGAQPIGPPYPTGGVGGVFLIPSGSPGAPAAVPTPPAASTSLATLVAQQGSQIARQIVTGFHTPMGAQTPDDARNLAALASASAASPDTATFLRQTAARRQLGLPYVATGPGGAYIYNPATGGQVPVAQFNALTAEQQARVNAGLPLEAA
jgi:hypothetical protein